VPPAFAALAAISVAFAIALKPFYVGWWLAMPVVAVCSRQAFPVRQPFWRRLEFWLVPAIGLVYVLIVARGAYPAFLHAWSALYWRYGHRPWSFVLGGNLLALAALACIIIGSFRASRTPLGRALLAGTIAAWIGAVAQGKGLPYHYMPTIGLGFLLLAQGNRWTRLALGALASVWLAGLVFLGVDGGAAQRRNQVELAKAAGSGTVLVLGAYGDDAWSLNSALGRPWLSPHPALWWLVVSHGRDSVPGFPRWHAQDSLLRASLLPRVRPDVMLLGVAGIDVAPYLRGSHEWSAVLAGYRPGEVVAGYRVWRRIR
jgi:hypothetical protein